MKNKNEKKKIVGGGGAASDTLPPAPPPPPVAPRLLGLYTLRLHMEGISQIDK